MNDEAEEGLDDLVAAATEESVSTTHLTRNRERRETIAAQEESLKRIQRPFTIATAVTMSIGVACFLASELFESPTLYAIGVPFAILSIILFIAWRGIGIFRSLFGR